MGIFSRLGSLIKSNINDLISKAEDPEKMLNQVLIDMQSSLVEAKKQVAVAIGDEKRLKKQWDEQLANAKEWERKAMLAVRSGARQSRDKLAGLLWGDRGDEQARDSLKHSVSRLRQGLASITPMPVVADRQSVGLDPAAFAIDVAEFEQALKEGTPLEELRLIPKNPSAAPQRQLRRRSGPRRVRGVCSPRRVESDMRDVAVHA